MNIVMIENEKQKALFNQVQAKTHFALDGDWQERELQLLEVVYDHFTEVCGVNPLTFQVNIQLAHTGINCVLASGVICYNANALTTWTITHELAHAWDKANGWQFSQRMLKATRSGFLCKAIHRLRPKWQFFWYRVGSPPPPCGVDKNFNSVEDFAEAVTAFLYPDEAAVKAQKRGMPYQKWGYQHFHETPRGQFIRMLIDEQKQDNSLEIDS
jgi:hypothetical protein